MGKRIYIGNLPFSVSEAALNDLLVQCGTVESVKIITDRYTGQSKGFGFAEMSSDQEANDAIEKFNGHELDGRTLKVSEARPQANQGRGGGGGDRGGFRRNRY